MLLGDRLALAELYARYLPVLWRYAWAHLRPDEAAARDAVSESFLAALRGKHDPAKGSVAQWLMGIARHKIADARRTRGHAPRVPPDVADTRDPAEPLSRTEASNEVQRIMLMLDDEERLALEWKYLDGASVRDIAARLGRTEKAAEALLFRARDKFRRHARVLGITGVER
jgi:RNA polymerase sigma-70 factor (ECF subfamily)